MMEVDIDHLMEFDEALANELLLHPDRHLPLFEQARAAPAPRPLPLLPPAVPAATARHACARRRRP